MFRRPFDSRWLTAVTKQCAPVFARAQVVFDRTVRFADDRTIASVRWEVDTDGRARSAAGDPADDRWYDVAGVDYWIEIDVAARVAKLGFESGFPTSSVAVTGDAKVDGPELARRISDLLLSQPG